MLSSDLTHIDASGNAQMVDVGEKADSLRVARARGEVILQTGTIKLIRQGVMKKGDVLSVAQIAGIQAAKKTAELIPLCHPIQLHGIDVHLEIDDTLPGIKIEARVKTIGKTGVEMEALTAVSVAALTIYDMVKAVEKDAVIQNIRLLEKSGGRSGHLILNAS